MSVLPSKASLFSCTPNSFPLAIWKRCPSPLSLLPHQTFPFYWIIFISVLTCCNFFCLYKPNSQPHIPLQLPLHFSLLLHRKSPESHLICWSSHFSLFSQVLMITTLLFWSKLPLMSLLLKSSSQFLVFIVLYLLTPFNKVDSSLLLDIFYSFSNQSDILLIFFLFYSQLSRGSVLRPGLCLYSFPWWFFSLSHGPSSSLSSAPFKWSLQPHLLLHFLLYIILVFIVLAQMCQVCSCLMYCI